MSKRGSVSREGDFAVIRVHMDKVHQLRVALAECPCKAPKSNGTMRIRQTLSKALGSLQSKGRNDV